MKNISLRTPGRSVSALAIVATAASLLPTASFAKRSEPSVRTPVIRRPAVNVRSGRLATMKFEATSPAWSPDGRQIAFIEAAGESKAGNLWIASTSGALRKVTGTGADGCPAWTPDGRLVVAHLNGERFALNVVNTANGKMYPLVDGRTFPQAGRDKVPTNISFSPDGARVAFDVCGEGETMDESGKVLVMALKTGKVEDLKTPRKSVTSHPSWSPDGRYVAYQRLPKGWYYNRTGDESYAQVWVTDLRTGESRQVTTPEKEINFISPTWCPSGGLLGVEKWLVSMKRESHREAWLVNASNTEAGALLQDERHGSGGVEWAPDGRHYVYITSEAVNGKFVNQLWTGAVTSQQRSAALKLPAQPTASNPPTVSAANIGAN